MDQAWGSYVDEAAVWADRPLMQVRLGAIMTDLIALPGHPGRRYVKMSAIPRAWDHPSAATWKRHAQDGKLVTVQPGGPNTTRYAEVEQRGDIWEPVWSV